MGEAGLEEYKSICTPNSPLPTPNSPLPTPHSQLPTPMTTPQSRTGKLIQGLFGRFGKQNPEVVSTPTRQRKMRGEEFPFTGSTGVDEEETNWDDEEVLDNNRTTFYPEPIVPAEPLPPIASSPDLENWDEALPAATVTNSPTQQTRRSKNPVTTGAEDPWGDDLPNVTFPTVENPNFQPSPPSQINRAIGFWSAILRQFRRILPVPVRQLSDPILTAIFVVVLTIGIWFVDGFFATHQNPQVAATPITAPQIGPEQALIESIETQLSDITSQYPDDIIGALQVDSARVGVASPLENRLIVKLNPVWYLIDNERQDSITDRMWLQARANHFTKLELQNAEGESVARNPVVGKHMIILQRRQSY